MFLPDRYIKGDCPKCGTADQYGDNCENCGATYSPTDLKNPRSVVSGATPELRDSEHYFFELGKFEAVLREWLSGDVRRFRGVKAKLAEWLERRPARLGHLARRALLRLPDSGCAGQVLLRLARRADRLPRQLQGAVRRAPALDFDAFLKPGSHGRDAPLHRQGHRQLPRPVLAGDAARRRLPHADQAARQRLPDGERREDVQVARHLHHGAHLPRRRPQSGNPALLLRDQVGRRRRRPRPEPRGLHRAGELATWSASSSTSPAGLPASRPGTSTERSTATCATAPRTA